MFNGVQLSILLSGSRILLVSGLMAAASVAAVAASPASEAVASPLANKAKLARDYGKLPMSFEANHGQADKSVNFLSRGSGYGLYLTAQEAVLTLHKTVEGSGHPASRRLEHYGIAYGRALPASRESNNGAEAQSASTTDIVRMQLAGANDRAEPVGVDLLPGTANYILGNDPAKWHTNVPTFGKVRYAGVYPGVDLVYYGNQQQLEYDFVVAPRASVEAIRLHFVGATGVKLDAEGNLAITAQHGGLAFRKPAIYQMVDGKQQPVEGQFKLLADNTVGFAVGHYDRAKPLVIDPILAYSTYLGGSGAEYIVAIAVDSSGDAYVTGLTASIDFPLTAGAFQSVNFASATNGVSTAFISKLNASGTALLYSTFLGGNAIANTLHLQGDYGHGIAVDAAGSAYVTGWTYSADFPITSGAYQSSNRPAIHGLATGFVTKLNPSGTGLVYSTYLGGSVAEEPNAIALDSKGDAFISGLTFSVDFPTTPGALQTTNRSSAINGFNDFVTKLDPFGSRLLYSTYLGGSQENGTLLGSYYWTNPVVVDRSGNAYVEGFSYSSDFPVTARAFQTTNKSAWNGGTNITLSKLNSTGSKLLYSTYLGGTTSSLSGGLGVDTFGNAYVTGYTYDLDFPVTTGAFQTINKAAANPNNPSSSRTNGFVTKVNPGGTGLVYSTYLGGTAGPWGGDGILGLALDNSGDAYVAGYVMSDDFPVTANAYQATNHGATQCCTGSTYATNAFVTEFNSAGTALIYSTYLGGRGYQNPDGPGAYGDSAYNVAVGSGGAVFVVGAASSSDFPVTAGALETSYHSQQNTGFVAEFDLGAAPTSKDTVTALTPSANSVVPGTSVTFTAVVAPASGTGVPTGNMVFNIDEANVATVVLNSTGKATYSTSTLAAGQHYILASYAGSSAYSASGDGFNEIVTPVVPVLTPPGGTYSSEQIVTVTSPTKTGVLYYTVDGSTPSMFSTAYVGPITVNLSRTIHAIAVAGNDADSAVATGAYLIAGSPVVLAAPASAIGTPDATLNAYVNTQGISGSYFFEYGTSSSALTSSTTKTALSASGTRVLASAKVTTLASKTTYCYRVVVTSGGGTTSGNVVAFTTN